MTMNVMSRARQPTHPAEVARSNPLTRGTATGLLPIPGGVYETARRAVRRQAVAGMGGALGIRAGRNGLGAAQVSATSDWWDLEPGVSDPTTGPYCELSGSFTMLALVERYGNALGNAPIFGNLAPSVSPYYCWALTDEGGVGSISFSYNSAGTYHSAAAGSIGVGAYLIIAKRDVVAGTHAVWINGAQRVSAAAGTGSISYFSASGTRGVALGNFYNFTGATRSFNGAVNLAWLWSRALSDQEIAEVSRNPWRLFSPARQSAFFFGPSAGAGTTVAVPVGAVSVAGYAPTVTATANQTISVPVGAVSLAGYAPTISTSASQSIAVPAGAVTLAGYAPTVTATANQAIAVPAGAVSLTGYAPSVFTTAVTTIAVPAGAVSLAGFAPSVSYTTHAYIDVPKGAVTLTGYAPTVTGGESSIWTPVTTDSAVWSAQNVSAAAWTPQ